MFSKEISAEPNMYSSLRAVLYTVDVKFVTTLFEFMPSDDDILFEPDTSNLEAYEAADMVVYDLGVVDNNLKLATIDILHMKNTNYSKPLILVGAADVLKRALYLNRIGPLVARSLEKPFHASQLLSMIDNVSEEFMNVSLKRSMSKKVAKAFKLFTLSLITSATLAATGWGASTALAADVDPLSSSVASMTLPEDTQHRLTDSGTNLALPVIAPARLIKRTTPRYPRMALNSDVEGWVEVAYQVNEQGRPVNVKIIKQHPENVFGVSSINAVEAWRFLPAKFVDTGAAVMSEINISKINFSVGS